MRRRDLVVGTALASLAAACVPAARPPASAAPESDADRRFRATRDGYFLKILALYPVVSTYLGGDGYSPTLAGVNGRLRDWSASAIEAELAFLKAVRSDLASIAPASLSAGNRIDHAVVSAQVAYLVHMLEEKRWQERSVETYTQEPFRGIDFHIQQMPEAGRGLLGTESDWQLVAGRVAQVPAYLATARANLEAGKRAGNLPDRRMVKRDGIDSITASVDYFRTGLPAQAKTLLGDRPFAAPLLATIASAGEKAADACAHFAEFLRTTFDLDEKTDRFAIGEDEYRWRLQLLHIDHDPRELFDEAARRVTEWQERIYAAAAEVAAFEKIPGLAWGTVEEKRASVRAVHDWLDRDHPKDDDELFQWYRETIGRAVEYARQQGMFDVPKQYRIDVLPTPEVLGGGGASYYPAPPFKKSGVGRFYLGATKNDPVALAQQARADVADTAVHEGFPGHDWNYKVMNGFAREISNVRWLTPGEVEGCFSMWEDSMATEGWALYAEALMATPAPGRPHGFYTAAEHLAELEGQLFRSARVHVDVGIHTGRLTFDEAVDYFLENVSMRSGVRAAATAGDVEAQHRLKRSEGGIYRYSKWPTQAITYELGKMAIEDLRDRTKAALGPAFDLKKFHVEYMRMGSIPPGLFADELLARLGAVKG